MLRGRMLTEHGRIVVSRAGASSTPSHSRVAFRPHGHTVTRSIFSAGDWTMSMSFVERYALMRTRSSSPFTTVSVGTGNPGSVLDPSLFATRFPALSAPMQTRSEFCNTRGRSLPCFAKYFPLS
jgi:hypothetical protein